METQYVYPNLLEKNEPSAPFNKVIPERAEIIIQSHLNEFISERNKLIDLLNHYKKVKRRWTRADSTIKITGITLAGISGIATIIITPLIGIPIVAVVTGSFSALDLFITEALSIGLTAKRKKVFREICECLNNAISRMWAFQAKALQDKIITDQEMDGVREIHNECILEIQKLKKSK